MKMSREGSAVQIRSKQGRFFFSWNSGIIYVFLLEIGKLSVAYERPRGQRREQ